MYRPASYFEDTFAGKLSRRIEQIATSIGYFINEFPWHVGWIVTAFIISFVLLSVAHPLLLLVAIIWLILFLLISYPLIKRLFAEAIKLSEEYASVSGGIVDSISNISLVHSFSSEVKEESRLEKGLQRLSHVFVSEGKWLLWNKLHQGTSVVVFGIAIVLTSIYLFNHSLITVADFILVATSIPALSAVIWRLGDTVLKMVRNYGNLSDGIRDLDTDIESLPEGDTSLEAVHGNISFNNISFVYPGTDEMVLKDFSLSINAGEKIGIVGASGAGKSTLIKLLLRHYDPTVGSITIENVDITEVSIQSLRDNISLVPQDTTLFHRTLLENIHYAQINATYEEVITASKNSHAHDFITKLPEQYSTMVGERGVKLSGGQRQRVAIARAVLKNAPILVLDEATSALDSESEEVVQAGFHTLFKNRTVIAVAHRLSTLREMNRIIVIEHGKIIEDGSPEALLAKENGVFKKLWDAQKNGFV